MVTCAADVLFVILEGVGLIGEAVDGRLAEHESEGLAVAGWRAQVTLNELNPLRAGADCLRTNDVFALSAPDTEEA